MTPKEIAWTGISYLVVTLLALWIATVFGISSNGVVYVVGAISATEIAAYVRYNRAKSPASMGAKAMCGVLLALLTVVVNLAQLAAGMVIEFPEMVIPIRAVGSFVFPFILFRTMEKALANAEQAKNKTIV